MSLSHRRHFLQVASLATAGLITGSCYAGQFGNRSQAPSGRARGSGPLKVGFVYLGPVGDFGWTFTHEQGRQQLQKALGDQVITHAVENVGDEDAEAVIRLLAEDDHHVIFTTSFGFMDPTLTVAQDYPDRIFMHCSGYKLAPNLGTYLARFEQPRYLTGIIAGSMTQSQRIGYIAAFPIPEVIRGINAFTLGVRSVNSEARVIVNWIETWFNPQVERSAAQSLIDDGADVLTQHSDSVAAIELAQDAGIYAIGYHSDMSSFGPDAHLTAAVHRWGPFYQRTAAAILANTWTSTNTWQGFEGEMVDLAPLNPAIPAPVQEQVTAKRQAFATETASPFDGPIRDQQNQERVAANQSLSDDQQLSMDWFVEGVEGTIPT